MKFVEQEKRTIDYYNKSGREWAAARGGNEVSYWLGEMQKFRSLLRAGRILEIGSGSGRDALELIKFGYEYIGTDASKGLIEIAQEKNPGAVFENKSVFDLDYPEGVFDGFWTAATLLHIPKNRIDQALEGIARVVKPGSVGFISMKQGKGENEDASTGRWFAYYSQLEFIEVLERNGFEIKDCEIRHGDRDIWLIFYVFKKLIISPNKLQVNS